MPSRKAILNVTSRKKRDTMIPVYQAAGSTSGTVGTGTVTLDAATVPTGSTAHAILFMPTARKISGSITDHQRSGPMTFMKGYKENIQLLTSNGEPWVWRRIVFTLKGDNIRDAGSTTALPHTSAGNVYNRHSLILSDNTATGNAIQAELWDQIFAGSAGVDWNDIMSAPLERRQITVIKDRRRILRSGNASGTVRYIKDWIPLNKTLVYDDDEIGGFDSTTNFYSTTGKPGMGDLYVLDLFRPNSFTAGSGQIGWSPTGTLYWHER